jgi:hypothetical protein
MLLYSIVLTRGASLIRQEFCATTGLLSMIGDDGLCEQVVLLKPEVHPQGF